MSEYFLGIIFLLLNFLHGIFASGFIPILNRELGVDSALPFALYFLGILLGQVAIYKYPVMSRSKHSYPVYEILFGLTLIYMSFYNTELDFNIGRLLEGLATGFATPVLFSNVIQLKTLGSEGKRLALFNSVVALGFVLGPVCLSYLMKFYDYKQSLFFFGILFIVAPLIMFFMKLKGNTEDINHDLSLKNLFIKNPWFEKFSTLFLGKSFYGFFLAFAPSYLISYFDKSATIPAIMLTFSVVFIIGQVITEKLLTIVPKEHLEVYIPILMSLSLLGFFFTANPNFMYISALCQSILVFIGYINFTLKTNNAREFALFNSISDPAIVIGAFLANLGSYGVWGILLIMSTPIIRILTMQPSFFRAEHTYPFFGPITLYKTIKKHHNPLLEPKEKEIREIIKSKLYFEKFNTDIINSEFSKNTSEIKSLKIVFTGDFCPTPEIYSLSKDVEEFIQQHQLRCINLEGVLQAEKHTDIKKWSMHNIPIDDFNRLIIGENNQPIFNVISLVNNHIFDLGVENYHSGLQKLKAYKSINPVTSDLSVIEVNNLKIGIFSLTFGVNLPWKNDENIKRIKPEKILSDKKIQDNLKTLITEYKSKVDLLILSYHWGYESEYFPALIQRQCFEILSESGIDIINGHHSHIVQPFEVNSNNSKLCLYSCGNFITTPDMTENVYKQGVLYSVNILFDNGKPLIQEVKPYFIEPDQKNEISFISTEKSDSYNNWLKYSF